MEISSVVSKMEYVDGRTDGRTDAVYLLHALVLFTYMLTGKL
jgi:hypothetical protein